ncbi:DNA methylase [Yinghuangia seranimata]|uniref:DNA methylase n=1 Tax=Yinghuangia seranimata TaxID=408067 RepID=UPI00248CFF10|nr:DNA methylase [Yinghuangia seranimata]MDI2126943.1 DNA methylase [Yinghuangia seranimata]
MTARPDRPRLLDLFCCAGGAARGYQRAGWHVTGVDIRPQPRYAGDVFVRADAIEYAAEYGHLFDAIHASPPCQFRCTLNRGTNRWRDHPDLIGPTRVVLDGLGVPYAMENVPGSGIRRDVTLCGEMFGLLVTRHRYFELGFWSTAKPAHVAHRGRTIGWRHGEYFGPEDGAVYYAVYGDGGGKGTVAEWQHAMGIDWTDQRRELAEAIPPAYGQWIGDRLLAAVTGTAGAEQAA